MMNVQAIKAELYDLQSHVCNGRLTIHPDGSDDPNDRPCSGCSRIRELQHRLREAAQTEFVTPSPSHPFSPSP